MHLTFTKQSGKFDTLHITRADGSLETIECPKQRIIPHDMVHFAVESGLDKSGFLTRVKEGEAATFQMQAEAESDGVERLVEVVQGDAWSGGGSSAEDMLALYRVTCEARSCPPLAVTAADVDAIRALIAELDQQWQALPVGDSLTLTL